MTFCEGNPSLWHVQAEHFSPQEQAELIAQFLYSIPLAAVEKVLLWLKPFIPEAEQVGDGLVTRHVSTLLISLSVSASGAADDTHPRRHSGQLAAPGASRGREPFAIG